MELLTRNEILDADDLTYEDVDVPEWGGRVRVKSMTGLERDSYEKSVMVMRNGEAQVDPENIRAKLVARCLIGPDGRRLFHDDSAEFKALGGKSAEALDRVFTVCQRLSGIRKEDVDELTGNFTETATGDSPSNSL